MGFRKNSGKVEGDLRYHFPKPNPTCILGKSSVLSGKQ